MNGPTHDVGSERLRGGGPRCLLFVGLLLLYLPGLGMRGLSSAQEARTGIVVRTMLESGDWLRPEVPGDEAHQKPILYYWCAALAASVLGLDETSLRLPSALAAIATLLLVAAWSSSRSSVLAAALLATTPFFHHLGRTARVDMMLCCFVCLSLFAFQRAAGAGRSARSASRWSLLAGASLGLATLTKGLVGPALVGGALLVDAIVAGRPGRLHRHRPVRAALAAVVVAAPWFMAVGFATEGAFLSDFFVGDHVERAFGSGGDDGHPVWYYLGVLPLRTLPWCLLVLIVWRHGRREADGLDRSSDRRLLLGWAGFGLVFLSLVSYKRADYLLPLFPALALLLGRRSLGPDAAADASGENLVSRDPDGSADGARGYRVARGLLAVIALPIGFAVASIATLQLLDRWEPLMDGPWLREALHRKDLANLRLAGDHLGTLTAVLLIAFAAVFFSLRALRSRRLDRTALGLSGVAAALLVGKMLLLEPALDERVSLEDFCARTATLVGDGEVAALGLQDHELHYYLGRRPAEVTRADLELDRSPRWVLCVARRYRTFSGSLRERWPSVVETAPEHQRPLVLLRRAEPTEAPR